MPRRGSLISYIRSGTNTVPLIPNDWDSVEEANDWATIYPLGRVTNPEVFFHTRLMMTHESLPRALYVCAGTPMILQHLANRIATDGLSWTRTWSSLGALRSDNSALAQAIKAAWKDERPRDENGDPLPMTELVALYARIAGFEDDDGEE